MHLKIILLFLILSKFASAQDSLHFPKTDSYEQYMEKQSALLRGKKFPGFNIPAGAFSARISDKNLANKVVFVNFWFTNCPPCLAEMKGLNLLYDSLKSNPDFIFLSITFDPDSVIKKTKKMFNIKYPIVRMDRDQTKRLNFQNGYPSSFVLDRNSVIIFFRAGGDDDEENATEDVLRIFYPRIAKLLVPAVSE